MNSPTVAESIAETSKEIEKRAQSYIDLGYDANALMTKIRNDALRYYTKGPFTVSGGVDIASMMLAAITLAKQAGQK